MRASEEKRNRITFPYTRINQVNMVVVEAEQGRKKRRVRSRAEKLLKNIRIPANITQ